MITTSISITPYLAEYLRGKYNNGADEPFRIPDNTDLYHVIWTLMSRRHQNQSPIDDGNLTIILPERRIGKDPEIDRKSTRLNPVTSRSRMPSSA